MRKNNYISTCGRRRSTNARFILTSWLKIKDSPGKFYKSSFDNKSYFHKSDIFLIINRQKIEEKSFHWLKHLQDLEKN